MANATANLHNLYASQVLDPNIILVNIGTNDLPSIQSGATTEAAWKASFATLLDSLNTHWPNAQILVARVYYPAYSAQADTLNDTWIPAVLATRGAFAAVGIDERTFLGDPGNLEADNLHPTLQGYDVTAAEWQTAMGY